MSKRKKRADKQRKSEITKGIFSVLESDPDKSFNYKQIASKLGISDPAGRNMIIKRLGQLAGNEKIAEVARGKYKLIVSQNYYTGVVDMTGRNKAYVVC